MGRKGDFIVKTAAMASFIALFWAFWWMLAEKAGGWIEAGAIIVTTIAIARRRWT